MKIQYRLRKVTAIIAVAFLFVLMLPMISVAALSPQVGDKVWVDTKTPAYHNGDGVTPYKYGGYDVRLYTIRTGYGGTPNYDPQYGGKVYLYCIHHTKGFTSPYYGLMTLNQSPYWSSLTQEAQKGIIYTTIYGFPARTPAELGAPTVDDAYAATQVLLWEFQLGYRTVDGGLTDSRLHTGYIQGTPAELAYQTIAAAVNRHRTTPSFQGASITLDWNGTNFSTTLTDGNGVLSGYQVVSTPVGVSSVIDGNTLRLTSTSEVLNGTITMTRSLPALSQQGAFALEASSGTEQEMVIGCMDDPVSFSFTVTAENPMGYIRIAKTDAETGAVLSGVTFGVYDSGGSLVATLVTDSSGSAVSGELPIGAYTVKETGTAAGYVLNTTVYPATVTKGNTVVVSVGNTRQKGTITLIKQDAETGDNPQGDAALTGAVYEIYDSSRTTVVDTLTFGGATATSKELELGTYYYREKTAPAGYRLDTAFYEVTVAYVGQNVAVTTVSATAADMVIRGRIAITKHADDGSTQIETPESGAVFAVYLASAGSYDAADESERDWLVCNDNGYAVSKNLPYGVYTVHQVSGWEGREKIPDFTVFISEQGKAYSFLINNAIFTAKLRIEKRDVETRKLIAVSGIGFQILDPGGNRLVQHLEYPTPTDIDTFYTNEEGWLMLPQPLSYGLGYQLIEVQTAPGYVLDPTPVLFDVTGENSVITVTKTNTSQKARIHIDKVGEVFSSVTVTEEGWYQPRYAEQSLAGATFAVYADEDIVVNGEMKAAKDTLVATLTTMADGATSEPLYLGRYRVEEVQAPDGMVLMEQPVTVTLAYQGQTVSVFTENFTVRNERQKARITFTKTMESDEQWGIDGSAGLAAVRMGLYAAEELVAADGSVIPADGLLEIVSVDAEGQGVFTVDLPVGSKAYLKEVATDDRYRLSDAVYPLFFDYADQDVPLVELTANDGEPIENRLLRGSLKLIKTFEGKDTPLAGVSFTLTGKTMDGSAVILTAITDNNGGILWEDLPIGKYVVREIAGELTTGYALSAAQTVMVAADQITELTIENRLIRGGIRLVKTDRDTGARLAGAEFALFAPDGSELGGYETNENGELVITDLPYGVGYRLVETAAPEGYVLDANPLVVDIVEDGATVELRAVNERVPEVPETGERSRRGWFAGLAVGSSAIVTAGMIRRKRKKA